MIPWRRAWQPTPVLLLGESPWTEESGGLQSRVAKSQTHWVTKHSTEMSIRWMKHDWEFRQEPGWALGGERGAASRIKETYCLTRALQCLGNSGVQCHTEASPEVRFSDSFIPPLTQQALIICLLCANTVPGSVALHWIKPTKPISSWNLSVHSRRIPHSTLSFIHQRRPRLVTWFVPWD